MSIFTPKISDDLFLDIDHVFNIFNIFTLYDPFFATKIPIPQNNSLMTHLFTLFVLSHTNDNTTSQNIGGTDAWAVPPPPILWGPSPQSPLGLRQCKGE